MIAILQAITRWIKTFKGSYIYVFCDNFAVAHEMQKTFIRREVMQPLRKIAMLYTEHDIEMQVH